MPRRRAREHQVGDIGAGDQQYKRYRSKQDQQRGLELVRNKQPEECLDINAPVFHFRKLLRDATGDSVHLSLRLLDRDAAPETRDRRNYVIQTWLAAGVNSQRCPNLSLSQNRQRCGRDSYECVNRAVQRQVLSDERSIAVEAALPYGFADHGHRRGARQVLALAKGPACHGLNTQQRNQRGADGCAREVLRVAAPSEIIVAAADGAHGIQRVHQLFPGEVVGDRGSEVLDV